MLKKILNTFFTKFIGAILTFVIAIVLSHAVGPAGKGEQALLLTTLTFILLASDIVSGSSLVYLLPKHSFSKLFLPAYVWSICIGLLSIGLLPAFSSGASWLYSFFASVPDDTASFLSNHPNSVVHLGLLAIVASVNSVNISMLMGRERVPEANYLNLWQPFGLLCTWLFCFFVLKMENVDSYITALYVSYGVSWLFGLFLLRSELRNFTLSPIREYGAILKDLFKYGILNELSTIVQKVNMRVTYFLFPLFFGMACSVDAAGLTHTLGEHFTGIFSNAVSIAEAVWIISRSIALVQFARIANSTDRAYSQKLTIDLVKICFGITAVGICLLALFPSAFYVRFFGPGFGEVAPLVRLLVPGSLMASIYLIIDHYYSGIGKYHVNVYAALCGLLFTVVLGLVLIPRYNIYGAAITTSVSYAANAIFLMFVFKKDSGFSLHDYCISRYDWHNYVDGLKSYCNEILKK